MTLSPKGLANQLYKHSQETPRLPAVPANYNIETKGEQKIATLQELPLPNDIPFEFESQLVIEYYWKVK